MTDTVSLSTLATVLACMYRVSDLLLPHRVQWPSFTVVLTHQNYLGYSKSTRTLSAHHSRQLREVNQSTLYNLVKVTVNRLLINYS